MKESDNWYISGRGDGVIELGFDDYIIGRYANNTDIGNGTNENFSGKRDALAYRGSGYLHLTGRYYNHLKSRCPCNIG